MVFVVDLLAFAPPHTHTHTAASLPTYWVITLTNKQNKKTKQKRRTTATESVKQCGGCARLAVWKQGVRVLRNASDQRPRKDGPTNYDISTLLPYGRKRVNNNVSGSRESGAGNWHREIVGEFH